MELSNMGFFSSRRRRPPSHPNPKARSAGEDLRMMALTIPPHEIGMKPSEEFPSVYGMLMDWFVGDMMVTLFATMRGTASLYSNSTFGIIGGEAHEAVRKAAIDFVRAGDSYLSRAKATSKYAYPLPNSVRFTFLTFEGVRFLDANHQAILDKTSDYASLFGSAQDVVSELRLIAQDGEPSES
jgi:hypothetical protein